MNENILFLQRSRYNALRHNPLELVMLLDLFVVIEEDNTYTILKNKFTGMLGNYNSEELETMVTEMESYFNK